MEERQGEGEAAARPLTRRELRRLAALADGPERAETGMATDQTTSRPDDEPGAEVEQEPWVAAVGTEHVPVDVVWPSGDEAPAQVDADEQADREEQTDGEEQADGEDGIAADDDPYRTVVLPRPPVEDVHEGPGHDEAIPDEEGNAVDRSPTSTEEEAAAAPVRISVLGDSPAPGQAAPWQGVPAPWSHVGGSRGSAGPFAPVQSAGPFARVHPEDATAEQPAVHAAAPGVGDVPGASDEDRGFGGPGSVTDGKDAADQDERDEPEDHPGEASETEAYPGEASETETETSLDEAYESEAYTTDEYVGESYESEAYETDEAGGDVPQGPSPGPWVTAPADVAPVGAVASASPAPPEELPTLTDLLAARPEPRTGPAELGWRAAVRRLTGGLVAPAPGPAEVAQREAIASVQRTLDGPKTIVVINPKGGAHKTTTALLIAATFGVHRGGYTLAWDNNETRGTMGWRSRHAEHQNTAVNLLQDLERFADPGTARVGDLDRYVRSQGAANFDVLASDEDAASAASIDSFAFEALHRTLARFYRVMVVDTGNNMRASNWQAAIEAADQVVIVSTVREDTAQSAAWAVDALRATGHEDVVRNAVTVLADPAVRRDPELARRLHDHFGRLTRAVVDVPYDPGLVGGGPIDFESLSAESRTAWLRVTAAVADGL